MGDKTNIEYLDATWNPIKGCSHVSPGCENCWAERQAARFSKSGEVFHGLTSGGRWSGPVRFYEKELYKPLHWKRPRRIGVCFMGDLFHPTVLFDWVSKIFAVMAKARQHTFVVLTKRPERMLEFIEWAGSSPCPSGALYNYIDDDIDIFTEDIVPWPLPNVLLGVSVEDQGTAAQRIAKLLRCDAALRYVSIEPMLGPIDLTHLDVDGAGDPDWCQIDALTGRHTDMGRPCKDIPAKLGWVVCGGESGPGARPMHPDWARSIRDQCKRAAVPFFMKQMAHREVIPGDLFIRQFPAEAK